MARALVCIDYINEIVGDGGKIAVEGYRAFADEHRTLGVAAGLLERCRDDDDTVVMHVRVGFDPHYLDLPAASPLLGAAATYGALTLGKWGTEFVPEAVPAPGELVFRKPRVSSFYGTALESALRAQHVTDVLIAGVSTELAVQSAARDAHDRDFAVTVVGDACGSLTLAERDSSLQALARIARIANAGDL